MAKQVTLTAQTQLTYGGRSYGPNMQFNVDADDVADLVKSKQAAEATARVKPTRVVSATEVTAPANDKVAAKAPVETK